MSVNTNLIEVFFLQNHLNVFCVVIIVHKMPESPPVVMEEKYY